MSPFSQDYAMRAHSDSEGGGFVVLPDRLCFRKVSLGRHSDRLEGVTSEPHLPLRVLWRLVYATLCLIKH